MELLILTTGLIASVLVVALSLVTKRKKIIWLSLILCLTTGTQYALLGEIPTVVLSAITVIYGILTFFEHKFRFLTSRVFLYGLLAAYTAAFFLANGFTWSPDLMAYGASILGTVVMMMRHEIGAKTVMLVSGLLWLAFQLVVGAYGQIPGELFYIAGCVFTLYKLQRRAKKNTTAETPVENTEAQSTTTQQLTTV